MYVVVFFVVCRIWTTIHNKLDKNLGSNVVSRQVIELKTANGTA